MSSSTRSPPTAAKSPSTEPTTPGGSWSRDATCAWAASGRSRSAPSPDHLYHHRSVFEVIDRPRRIVLATTEVRPEGSGFDFSVEFTFEEQDGRTRMSVIQSGFPTPELRDEHGRGVPNAFARLERAIRAS